MNQSRLESAVVEAAKAADGGRLRCARALGIARSLAVSPHELGDAANRLDIRIIDCQLGCFGLKKARHEDLDDVLATGAVADAIDAALENGFLPCSAAFEVARQTSSPPKLVGDVATKKTVGISACQLGCFP